MVHFAEIFDIPDEILESFGAFNISLINDLPVFIDPFLLYGSEKPEYLKLHQSILDYLLFLKEKSTRGNITDAEVESWYKFSEVKQNWLGYSLSGNDGTGLGKNFGYAMSKSLHIVFDNNNISATSHLEKVTLFQMGVGKDNISDFTCNLIKGFLLEYTEAFAKKYLQPNQTRLCNVEKAYFDYKLERWMARQFTLPIYNGDYIILTPRDILTKDENWINGHDLRGDFIGICNSIPNTQLRQEIHSFYKSKLPPPTYVGKGKNRRQKAPKAKDVAIAINHTLNNFPIIIDYFIKQKEQDAEKAKSIADEKVGEVETVFIENVKELIKALSEKTNFYQTNAQGSYQEALTRVNYLKDVIENNDGYRVFYCNGEPIKRESDLHVMYRLTWHATTFDVNSEVNNGRGPVDFTVSYGSVDKTNVEFKLASNSKLKMNLENQTKVYETAGKAKQTIKVILYFDSVEYGKTMSILKELNMENDKGVVLIDAGNNKPSASNVKKSTAQPPRRR